MNLHGPQGDRDRILGGKWDGRRDALGKDEQVLEGEMARLRNENKTLRDQLSRALKELKAYQIKYPSPYVPTPGDDDEMSAWSAAPAIMSPLLEAYDSSKYHLPSPSFTSLPTANIHTILFIRNLGVRRYHQATKLQVGKLQRKGKSHHYQ